IPPLPCAAHTAVQPQTAGPVMSGNPGAGNLSTCGAEPPAGQAGVPAPASHGVPPGQQDAGAPGAPWLTAVRTWTGSRDPSHPIQVRSPVLVWNARPPPSETVVQVEFAASLTRVTPP